MRLPGIAAAFALAVPDLWAQVNVYVTAPQVRITSGDAMQLSAVARNAAGNTVNGASFQWTSSDARVLQVDSSGRVTAGSLGLVDITAAMGNARGILRIQVLPQRIEVSPRDVSIPIGSQQPFSATAFNSRGEPIPDAVFTWHVAVMGGFDSSTVPIRGGVVSAATLGFYRVRAAVVYPFSAEQFEREFDGSTGLTITPAGDYTLSSLAAGDYSRPVFGFRGRRGNMAANDAGTLVFSGVLDGMANGLFQMQSGRMAPIATAGAPSLLPGTVAYDFDDPSVDSRGNILVRMANIGSGAMAVLFNSSGVQLIAADNAASDRGLDLNNIFCNRFSLSESGDAVIRANFHYDGSTNVQQGLFRYSGGGLVLETAATDPLPGIADRFTFDDQFGIDGAGVIYFLTNAPSRVVFRKEAGAPPTRVLGLNDTLSGSTVAGISQLAISSGGDLIVYGSLARGGNFTAIYRNGGGPAQVFMLPYINSIFSVSAAGSFVFTGDGGAGYGLYSWNPARGGGAPQPVLLRGRPLPTGEAAFDLYSATIDSTGRVFAAVRGVSTPWLLMAASPAPAILATAGDTVSVTANFNFSTALVPGDRSGPPHVLAGGNQASILHVTDHGLLPVLIVNDKLPGGNLFTGAYPVRKSASGDLYVTTDQASYRLASGSTSQILSFPMQAANAVNIFAPFNMSVNSQKQVAFISNTNSSHQRLMFGDGTGAARTIAYFNGSAAFQTPSPAGGNLAALLDVSLNESGLVMVNASVSGGQGGLFLYDGSGWQSACVVQSCQLGGETITAISGLRSAGNRFCAVFTTRLGNVRIDCWDSGAWVNVVKRGDVTSDGTELNSIGAIDVNANGDVSFVGYTGIGGPSVFLKRADRLITAYAVLFPLPDGASFRSIYSLDMRDDGRLYFIGMDFSDRMNVYEAIPHF